MVVPTNIKQLQNKSRDLQVRRVDRNTYVVTSMSNAAVNHIVTVTFDEERQVHARCTCRWAQYNGIACSHVLATLEHLATLKQRKLSFWVDEGSARRQKRPIFRLTSGRHNQSIWITSRTA